MGDTALSVNLSGPGEESENEVLQRDLIIIGAGPAGLAAGIYAGRAQLHPLILVGRSFGGQVAAVSQMENYPGFPEGIAGVALSEQMAEHAKRFGAELTFEEVTSLDLAAYPFVVKTYGTTYEARSLIICTGTSPRKLGVPGEDRFFGRGVSVCATCDGYFFRNRTVVLVGGGDSALHEGLYLARLAQEVVIIHRRDRLRAGPTLRQRAMANEKIRFVWNSVVDEILGEDVVTGVRVHDVVTGEESVIETDGVFVYVGLIPNTQLVKGMLELAADGYIKTDRRQRTSVPGVYAAGDVQDPWFRQVVTAAGAGAAAAIEAARFLEEDPYDAPGDSSE